MQIVCLTRKFKITNVPVALLGFLVSGVLSAKFAKPVSLKAFSGRLFVFAGNIVSVLAFRASHSDQFAHEKDPILLHNVADHASAHCLAAFADGEP